MKAQLYKSNQRSGSILFVLFYLTILLVVGLSVNAQVLQRNVININNDSAEISANYSILSNATHKPGTSVFLGNSSYGKSFSTSKNFPLYGYEMNGMLAVKMTKNRKLSQIPETDVLSFVQGRVAGLDVFESDGRPGSSIDIRIHGIKNFTGTSQPLIIIDDIPLFIDGNPEPSALSNIHSSDISSLQVMKDVSSTTVYGSKGINGVIIIGTKNGIWGGTKIDLKSSFGFSDISRSYEKNKNSEVWYSNIGRRGFNKNLHVGIRTGGDNSRQYYSFGVSDNEGVLEKSGRKRYTAILKSDNKLFRNVDIGTIIIAGHSLIDDYALPFDSSNYWVPVKIKTHDVLGKLSSDIDVLRGLSLKNYVSLSYNMHASDMDNSRASVSDTLFSNSINQRIISWHSGIIYQNSWGRHDFSSNTCIDNSQYANACKTYNEIDRISSSIDMYDDNYRDIALTQVIQYNYNSKYIIKGSLRYESSDRFKFMEDWVAMPSLAGAWRVSNEEFIYSLSFITDLKVRYSIGRTTNSRLFNYPLNAKSHPSVYQSGLPVIVDNPGLDWEKVDNQNLGLDLGMFRNRIVVGLDRFHYSIYDMYLLSPLEMDKRKYEWINAGNYKNGGWDISLTSILIQTGNAQITFKLNAATNTSKITKVSPNVYNQAGREIMDGIAGIQILKVGDPVGVYYGYRIINVDEEMEHIDYADEDGNGIVDENDMRIIANTNPKWYGGMQLKFGYAFFNLISDWNWKTGNEVINTESIGSNYVEYTSNLNNGGNRVLNNLYVERGSYLRWSKLSLEFNFPNHWVNRIKLNRMGIALSMDNLLTFTSYTGQDPEFNSWTYNEKGVSQFLTGVDRNYYPSSRGYFLSINMGF